jgi:hypothetical protein
MGPSSRSSVQPPRGEELIIKILAAGYITGVTVGSPLGIARHQLAQRALKQEEVARACRPRLTRWRLMFGGTRAGVAEEVTERQAADAFACEGAGEGVTQIASTA